MTSAAGVTSQLQVLPQSVHFDDVSTDQPIYTTVTVKVIIAPSNTIGLQCQVRAQQPCKADAIHVSFKCAAELGQQTAPVAMEAAKVYAFPSTRPGDSIEIGAWSSAHLQGISSAWVPKSRLLEQYPCYAPFVCHQQLVVGLLATECSDMTLRCHTEGRLARTRTMLSS